MNKQKLPIKQLLAVIIGELIVSAAIIAVYLIIDKFSYKVALGALLGSVVTLANFIVLSVMTNRVLNNFLKERGEGEMSDEEAAALAAKYQGKVQAQIKLSFIIRNFVMLAALAVAFLIDIFDVIATVIPLLAFRPILTISELIGRKADKNES